ncbi:hypothetical protein CK203_002639 [Vitis vinifera]|uniref:Uncharacterized protein n=1 Tax=Vitis vinifera TaxID=29760 RepID=A0A438KHB7_VITVI|nr:hypothetical protein CK203_002639 [Vitis vinifera]
MFQAMGFLAPLAPRALPDPVPHSFVLIYIWCSYFVPSVARDVMTGPVTVECEEFEPRVDLAWRGISYDLWEVYDMWIGRLLDETVTYFVREVQTQLERTLFHQGADPRRRCMADGFRRKPILRANQCGSAKEVDHHFSSRIHCFAIIFIVACDSSHSLHALFSPRSDPSQASSGPWLMSFLSFLSPYNLGLRYVPCLKTTLRPWDQMSSSAASTWAGHLGYMCTIQLWIRMTSVTCATMDDFMTFVLRTCRALDVILGHISFSVEIYGSSWSCTPIPTYEIHIDTMFPPWSLSGVTQLGLHLATLRCHHAFLPRDAPLI